MWVRCRSWLVLKVVELAILMQDWWATYLWKIMHVARCATWSVISHYDTTLFRLAYTVVLFVLFLLPIDGRALHCIYWWWCGHCGGSHRPIIQFRAHPGEAPRVQDSHPCKWMEMQLYVTRVVCARIVSCRMQIYCVYVHIDEDHGTGQGSVLHPALPGSSPDIGEAMVPAVCPTSVQYMYIYCLRSHMCPKLYLLFLCFSAIMFRKHFAAKQRLKKRRVAVFVADRFRRRSLGLVAYRHGSLGRPSWQLCSHLQGCLRWKIISKKTSWDLLRKKKMLSGWRSIVAAIDIDGTDDAEDDDLMTKSSWKLYHSLYIYNKCTWCVYVMTIELGNWTQM